MIITDSAKKLINEALAANKRDCLEGKLEKSCCGVSLEFGLGKLTPTDKPISVNGISVLMDANAQARAEKVTLDAENGEIVFHDKSQSCCG